MVTNIKNEITRRQLLQLLAASSTSLTVGAVEGSEVQAEIASEGEREWNQGELSHLLPTVNHNSMLVKTSFVNPLQYCPYLSVGGRKVSGEKTDTLGRFWQFYITDLKPDTTYQLRLQKSDSSPITDTWPLKTFPHPTTTPDHLRVLTYTCAGGNEDVKMTDGVPFFQSLAIRQRIIDRALDCKPDVVIANGDHVYWDQRSAFMRKDQKPEYKEPWEKIFKEYGSLERDKPVLGTSNESILTKIVDPQIANLYGVRFRSVPMYMLTDDHDLFENDDATDDLITLPPDEHMLDCARSTQYLYYPEFLPDATRPTTLSGNSKLNRIPGLSEVYGTLRYGQLFEALLYDTKRYSTIDGDSATVFPLNTEQWLAERTAADDTTHLLHIPSTPIGWSAGKWGEWYPDVLLSNRTLGTEKAKPYWPRGWWHQHQRVLKMLGSQKHRTPVIASGDLHAFSYGKITKSADMHFDSKPIHTMCVGTLGSSDPLYPSYYRKVGPQIPTDLEVENLIEPSEKNGFTVMDISPTKMVFKMFSWRQPEAVEAIDRMEPFFTYEVSRS